MSKRASVVASVVLVLAAAAPARAFNCPVLIKQAEEAITLQTP